MKTNSNLKTAINQPALFIPLTVGAALLKHRVVMAPLTRLRSEAGDVPGELMVTYYQQRASAGGLIITESTEITPYGSTYPAAPGIYTEDQIAGWKKVTEGVHAKGGYIFLQLFHGGRTAHPDNLPGHVPGVAPSAILAGGTSFTVTGSKPFAMPRELAIEEIPSIINDYRQAAINAITAGFDGVEILGGGGYLIDQFLQDGSNQRTDAYGGSIANRARLLLEITAAIIAELGSERVAVRINPDGKFNEMNDSTPEETFSYVAREMDKLNLAYLHIVEPRIKGSVEIDKDLLPIASKLIRQHYKGIIIAAGGFVAESAAVHIDEGHAELVAFGRHFIANPDLPERIRLAAPLNPYDRSTFYGGDTKGYTDYRFHEK